MIAMLTQKRGLEQRQHTLLEDRVVVETKTATKSNRYEVPLESLRFNLQYQSDNKSGNKIAAAILLIIPTLLTIAFTTDKRVESSSTFLIYLWGCIAFIFLLKLINPSQDDVFLTGGKNHLVLFRTTPNEVAVMTFINQIHETVKTHLRDKYLSGTYNDEADYHRTLQWLLSEKVISPVEAQRYRENFQSQNMEVLFRPSLN